MDAVSSHLLLFLASDKTKQFVYRSSDISICHMTILKQIGIVGHRSANLWTLQQGRSSASAAPLFSRVLCEGCSHFLQSFCFHGLETSPPCGVLIFACMWPTGALSFHSLPLSRYALEELSFFEEFYRSLAWVSKWFFFPCHVKGRKLDWVRVGIWHPIIKGHVKFRGWSRPTGSFKCRTKTSKRSCKPDSGSFDRFQWLSRAGGVLVALLFPFSRPCLRKSYLNES